MAGRQWPRPGLATTPAAEASAQHAELFKQRADLYTSVVIRAGQWADLRDRLYTAGSNGSTTTAAQLKALLMEAHTRLARGW